MSVRAISAVFEDSKAVDSAFTVALALADWCDHAGRCYPSYTQIAEKARVSRATAIVAVQALVDLGEWAVEKHGAPPSVDDEDGPSSVRSQWRNFYRCLLIQPRKAVQNLDHHTDGDAVQSSDHHDAQVVQPSSAGGPTDTPQVVQPTPSHIRNKPSEKPSGRPSEERTRRHHRHAFCPPDGKDGFCVPEFLHAELTTMLGGYADEFDLLFWYVAMDTERRTTQPTVLDGLAWWREQLRDAIRQRGWAPSVRRQEPRTGLSVPNRTCPHTPRCASFAACRDRVLAESRASGAA